MLVTYLYLSIIYLPMPFKKMYEKHFASVFLVGNWCCKGMTTRYLCLFSESTCAGIPTGFIVGGVSWLVNETNTITRFHSPTPEEIKLVGSNKHCSLKDNDWNSKLGRKKCHSILNGYRLSYPHWRFRQFEFVCNKAGCHHWKNVSFGILPVDLPWSLSNAMAFFPRDPRNRSYLTQPTTYLVIYLCVCISDIKMISNSLVIQYP